MLSPTPSVSCRMILRCDMVYSFTWGVRLGCSGKALEPQCWGSPLPGTLPCYSLHGLAFPPEHCIMQRTFVLYPLFSLEETHSLFVASQDILFSLSFLENSLNFFNGFSFYKYLEESVASSNFNCLLCVSYWGKKIPRARWCVWNGKGKTEKEQT